MLVKLPRMTQETAECCCRCRRLRCPPPLPLQLAKAVEKAIKTSPLSLNAVTEGSEVLVKLPRMTQETIDRMVKLVHMEAEGAHQSIRRARQKGMDAVKKAFKSASQDEKKRQEKEVRGLWLSSWDGYGYRATLLIWQPPGAGRLYPSALEGRACGVLGTEVCAHRKPV